jgi:hypothetical protein
MPCREPVDRREFAAAWTRYAVTTPPELGPAIAAVAPSTPAFWDPTHTVSYAITATERPGYRLSEQGDDVGLSGDADWIASTLSRRIRARLTQIAGLSGWAPLSGALADIGSRRVLLLAAAELDEGFLGETTVPGEVGLYGHGTCLVRPDRAAVVGAAGGRPDAGPELVPCHRPADVVLVDTGDRSTIEPATTPQLMERILESVIDSSSLPPSVPATGVRALTTARAWLLTVSDPAATLGMIVTHLG